MSEWDPKDELRIPTLDDYYKDLHKRIEEEKERGRKQRLEWDQLVTEGKDKYYRQLNKKEQRMFSIELLNFLKKCGYGYHYTLHELTQSFTAPVGVMRAQMDELRKQWKRYKEELDQILQEPFTYKIISGHPQADHYFYCVSTQDFLKNNPPKFKLEWWKK